MFLSIKADHSIGIRFPKNVSLHQTLSLMKVEVKVPRDEVLADSLSQRLRILHLVSQTISSAFAVLAIPVIISQQTGGASLLARAPELPGPVAAAPPAGLVPGREVRVHQELAGLHPGQGHPGGAGVGVLGPLQQVGHGNCRGAERFVSTELVLIKYSQ